MRHREGTIQESLATLQRLERKYRHKPLKTAAFGLAPSQRRSLPHISSRFLPFWASPFLHLATMVVDLPAPGKRPVRIGGAGLEELKQRLQHDGFADLKEIQSFIFKGAVWGKLRHLFCLVSWAYKA
jgi:hypothetical protein